MAHFLTAVALNLSKVTRQLVQTILFLVISLLILTLTWLRQFGYVDYSGRSKTFLMLLSLIVFLLIAPSLSKKLGVVKTERSCRNWAPDLEFIWPGIFCQLRLEISLDRSDVYQLIALVARLIDIAADRSLYLSLGLSSYGLLN